MDMYRDVYGCPLSALIYVGFCCFVSVKLFLILSGSPLGPTGCQAMIQDHSTSSQNSRIGGWATPIVANCHFEKKHVLELEAPSDLDIQEGYHTVLFRFVGKLNLTVE